MITLFPRAHRPGADSANEDPIRSELFSRERFDEHARSLAEAQKVSANPKVGVPLGPRVRDNGRRLRDAYRYLKKAIDGDRSITPAAEWLVDSFHVVDERLREIKRDLPRDFYDELPKLSEGFLAGFPRIYGVAWAYVAHTDSRFDQEVLQQFVETYQKTQPLTMGELWALAITLRVVMIENLRRLSVRVVDGLEARRRADGVADRILGIETEAAPVAYADLERIADRNAYLVQLLQRLRYHDPVETPAVKWLHELLASIGRTDEEISGEVHRQMGEDNITVRNIITSFRAMGAFDWRKFFENVSLTHRTLARNPAFPRMDFPTRDLYRHAIEDLSRTSEFDEFEVAARAVAKADAGTDPGYFLVGAGHAEFAAEIGARAKPAARLRRLILRHALPLYLCGLAFLTLVLLALPFELAPGWLVIFAAIPASELGLAFLNRAVTETFGPRRLPRLELKSGPDRTSRTLVVVPTMLWRAEDIHEQIEKLEVHYLANPDGEVVFGLATDWADAETEKVATDDGLWALAREEIANLNRRHGPAPFGSPRFHLFHRRRLWNPSEAKWMGWERKRGKLEELNALLRGSATTSFFSDPDVPPPSEIRYVITLDSDTRLPKSAVNRLVGTMAHPLNRARIDPALRKVVEGYGILQPRITASLPSREERSIYQRLFSGECGIDPYASAVSDVYQDLFAEGSFTGKGIYDLDAFEATLRGRIPENALLSHDLFEGSFARCGFASTVELFEEFPSHVEVADSRNHRWIRGDWQLLPWIFGREGRALSALARWKMIDNLRRSLVYPSVFVLLAGSLFVPAAAGLPWLVFALLTLAGPPLLPFLIGLVARPRNILWTDYARDLARDLNLGLGHFAVSLILLPHRAARQTDAIVRANWRLFVSHRHRLEWVTAAQAKSLSSSATAGFLKRMGIAMILGLAVLFGAALEPSPLLPTAAALGLLWVASPMFSRWISLPFAGDDTVPLSAKEIREVRLHGRRIWRFFTTFVTAEDHHLPPDNFQEDPDPVIAHRSSPTNFGLYLLSAVAATDFGWSGIRELSQRLEATLASMKQLPRFRGHFYNWYETREFRPLDPKYVSAVDSGNLAGHLIVLGQACQELKRRPILTATAIDGMSDTLRLLRSSAELISDDRRSVSVPLGQLLESIHRFEERLARFPSSPFERAEYWDALVLRAESLRDTVTAYVREASDLEKSEVVAWAEALYTGAESHANDFRELFPWASLLGRRSQVAGGSEEDAHFAEIERLLSFDLSLADCPARCEKAIEHCESLRASAAERKSKVGEVYFDTLIEALTRSADACRRIAARFEAIAAVTRGFFNEMDFGFLFNEEKKLFSIGYRVAENELDEGCYDLLASEARLTSYVAIIKGDVPVSHWFRLGRSLAPVTGGAALISWSGSMFEYLMPSLVMSEPHGSLLDETCRLVVSRQIEYGESRGVPWGISESAFNVRDLALTYQYSNFGVPGLGLKRGLEQDLVIAPYATSLAALYAPRLALENLRRIEAEGGAGTYGFYESMDYTPSRLRDRQSIAIVRAYMAHHQGMALLAFSNVIHANNLRKRFHADPLVQAAELLLQERTPRHMGELRRLLEEPEPTNVREPVEHSKRKFRSPHHSVPSAHLLSNGRYAVMVTAAGSGYSRWKNLAVTRWREDNTRDPYGNYFYLRDLETGRYWSPTFLPSGVDPDQSEISFSEHEARISRTDGMLKTDLEILVSVEDDAELRRLTISNFGTKDLELELTTYAEVVIAPPGADLAHPAFSGLFVQTEFLPALGALLATRRPRSAHEAPVFMAQLLSIAGATRGAIEYETDRAKFIGRGRSLRAPIALIDRHPLSDTVGAVLDPIFSLRTRIHLPAGASAKLCVTTLATSTREAALDLAEKYRHPNAFDRASTLTWVHSLAKLHHLGIEPDEAQLFQRLANRIIYSDPMMRPANEVLARNRLNVTGLWGRGISGDLPIVLVRVDEMEDFTFIRQLLRAHEFWRTKRLAVDIVILNEKSFSYVQDFQTTLESVARSAEATRTEDEKLGKIFVLRNDLLDSREKDLLLAFARVILNSRAGTLAEQVQRVRKPNTLHAPAPEPLPPEEAPPEAGTTAPVDPDQDLEFFNGLGGFAENGREYVILLRGGQRTPTPWLNVIANRAFGFQVSESGNGYTWSLNSRENQLTPWSNDPVVDPSSEAIYLKDLESGELWSPTASPIRKPDADYLVRHGMGYSRFGTDWHGIRSELTLFVAERDPVKFFQLRLADRSGRTRTISITGYVEWVLGFTRAKTAPYIRTEIDPETGAIFATNPMDPEFGGRVAFFDLGGRPAASTSDRSEFIGRNGTLERPAALFREEALSGTHGSALDPASVLQTVLKIPANGEVEATFLLGQAETRDEARLLVKKYRRQSPTDELVRGRARWEERLGKLQVRTPDRAMDILLNGWLLYQTLACRFWARAAFYQAGGAYGFRDQLQDTLALVGADRELVREHLLRATARQFLEGDVQHWWHPPRGRGVRTHFSDDLLWLPYVVSHYVESTGDAAILEEVVPFIEGPTLRPDQEDAYFEPRVAPESERATLFEHCARAIDRSLAVGAHGLPLIGSGDWNDGMNRVGHAGRGESVWVGWFLHAVLTKFIPLAKGDRATKWAEHAAGLKKAIETHAWDGEWYRRAYFDDGTPLGSKTNEECRIDSIAQTWAVLSGAGDPERARIAMMSVEKHLVREKERLILLFTPPFDRTSTDPGYIKGYLPGVRENGGQYTHAAIWCVCAQAQLGNGDRAHQLFSLLNPILHAANRTGVQTYKVEPYVLAADIYGVAPHTGRGGWTWYTGSSGWMYRAGVEYLLGIRFRGDRLAIEPNLPAAWAEFSATYRHGDSTYEILVENPAKTGRNVVRVELDGIAIPADASIPLSEDGLRHTVRVVLGAAPV
jgi:cyclic beta-1,2-glucan synthetase